MDIVLQHLPRPWPAHAVVARPVVAGEGGVISLLLRPLLRELGLLLQLVLLLLLVMLLMMLLLLLLLMVGYTRVHRDHWVQTVIVVTRGHIDSRPLRLPCPAPS